MFKKTSIKEPIVIEDLERFKSASNKSAFMSDKKKTNMNNPDVRTIIGMLRNGSSAGDISKLYADSVESRECGIRNRADYLDKLSNKMKKKKRTVSLSAAEKRYVKTLEEFQDRVFNNSPFQHSKMPLSKKKSTKTVPLINEDDASRQEEALCALNISPISEFTLLRAFSFYP